MVYKEGIWREGELDARLLNAARLHVCTRSHPAKSVLQGFASTRAFASVDPECGATHPTSFRSRDSPQAPIHLIRLDAWSALLSPLSDPRPRQLSGATLQSRSLRAVVQAIHGPTMTHFVWLLSGPQGPAPSPRCRGRRCASGDRIQQEPRSVAGFVCP
jgi:hypothetical protein